MTRWLLVALATFAIALAAGGASSHANHTDELVFRGEAGGGRITIVTTAERNAVLRATVEDVLFPESPDLPPTPPPNTTTCEPTTVTDTVHIFDPPVPITDGEVNVQLLFIGGVPAFSTISIESAFSNSTTIEGTASSVQPVPGVGFCVTGEVPFAATGPVETPPTPDDFLFEGTISEWAAELTLSTRSDSSGITSLAVHGIDSPCSYARSLIAEDELIDGSLFFDPALAFEDTGQFAAVMFLGWSGQVLDLERYTFTGRVLADHAEGTVRVDGIYFNGHRFCSQEASWTAGLVYAPPSPTASMSPSTAAPVSTTGPVALPSAGRGGGEAAVPGVLLLTLAATGVAGLAAARLRAR